MDLKSPYYDDTHPLPVKISEIVSGSGLATETKQDEIIKKLLMGDYVTNDVDDYSEDNVLYVGKENIEGKWIIMKIDMNSGIVIRGASEVNNPTVTSYADAWSNRLTLNYGYLREVI